MPTDSNAPECPPGLVGDVARFIFAQAPRPVHEIAIAGAIAFVAGIVGRQYNVSATGLNQFVMLVAPTGTGKEAVNQGMSKLVSACEATAPRLREHVGPGEIRSDAALLKQFAKSKCFVSVLGEVGLLIKRMSGPRANPNDVGIMRVWLDLWAKSGHGNTLNPMVYSDAAKSTDAVHSPAFSLFGESTPERFYEALDETMVADGLLPRFVIIEYRGDRPDLNEAASDARPSDELIAHIGQLVAKVNSLATVNSVVNVGSTVEAAALFRQFNTYCDDNIRGSKEVSRHVWNRAHLKALKLAAIVAVGVDWEAPVIDVATATWATKLVDDDAHNILGRFDRGEVGQVGGNETAQQNELRRVFHECLKSEYEKLSNYRGTVEMHLMGIVTHSYLSNRLYNLPTFKADVKGPSQAIQRAIRSLIDNGELEEVGPIELWEIYGNAKRAKAYRVPEKNHKSKVALINGSVTFFD